MKILSLFLYDIFLIFYYFFAALNSIWSKKTKLWFKGRKGLLKKIRNEIDPNNDYIWAHVSSLGEFEQGRVLFEMLNQNLPQFKLIITFFSPSGFEIRKNYEFAEHVFYLPLDGKIRSKKFIKIINPKLAIFMRYDLWYYYLKYLNQSGIPIILNSAVFNPNQIYFKKYAGIFKRILPLFDFIYVINKESKDLLNQHDIQNIEIVSDTRIDRVVSVMEKMNTDKIDKIEEFKDHNEILIVGSSYNIEEGFIKRIIDEELWPGKVIIVPHNINQEHISDIKNLFHDAVFWSKIDSFETGLESKKIMVIDAIGLLQKIYKYAEIAFIGGGFTKSIHNTLEPATFGIPILFGPLKHEKFVEAVKMKNSGGAFMVSNYDEFKKVITKLKNKEFRQNCGKICKKYINENQGGSEVIFNKINELLN